MNRKLQGEGNKIVSRLVVVLTCLYAKENSKPEILEDHKTRSRWKYGDNISGHTVLSREFRKILTFTVYKNQTTRSVIVISSQIQKQFSPNCRLQCRKICVTWNLCWYQRFAVTGHRQWEDIQQKQTIEGVGIAIGYGLDDWGVGVRV
jgi:hypothetical protein